MKSAFHAHNVDATPCGIAGFLLLDSALKPILVNDEAIRILSYPDTEKNSRWVEKFLGSVISPLRSKSTGSWQAASITRIRSGRRHYTCRLFAISPVFRNDVQATTVLLLERDPVSADLLDMAEKFNLTQREHQAVQLLALGLTSKEIADRMAISPNTVKAFLRMVMIKTGVTTRSGIIGKLLKTA